MLGFLPTTSLNGPADGTQLTLAAGGVRSITVSAGAVVRVQSGIVWITQVDDPFDYIVPAEGAFRAAWGGRLVIQSLRGPAVIAV